MHIHIHIHMHMHIHILLNLHSHIHIHINLMHLCIYMYILTYNAYTIHMLQICRRSLVPLVTPNRGQRRMSLLAAYGGESAPGALASFVPADSVEFPLVMWPKNWGSNQKNDGTWDLGIKILRNDGFKSCDRNFTMNTMIWFNGDYMWCNDQWNMHIQQHIWQTLKVGANTII